MEIEYFLLLLIIIDYLLIIISDSLNIDNFIYNKKW